MISPYFSQQHNSRRVEGWLPGSGMTGVIARLAADPGWQLGARPTSSLVGGGAVQRVLPEGVGKAACGRASKMPFGENGNEPLNVEGCGCGGGCATGELTTFGAGVQPGKLVGASGVFGFGEGPTSRASMKRTKKPCFEAPPAGANQNVFCPAPCAQAMEADASGCSIYVDQCEAQTITATGLQSLSDLGRWSATFITATQDEIDLYGAALAILAGNQDLIRWAVCMVGGALAEPRAELIIALVETASPLVVSLLETIDHVSASYNAVSFGLPFGQPWLGIQRDSPHCQNMLSMWRDSDLDTKVCAAIQSATMLLHELVHLVHLDLGETYLMVDFGCDYSPVIQTTFQWAILKRFPQALAGKCCSNLGDDSVFGCNSHVYSDDFSCTGPTDAVERWDPVGDVVDWLGNVTRTGGGGGGGGPDPEFCILCPSACSGGTWSGGPHDLGDCIAAVMNWIGEKTAIVPAEKLTSPGGDTLGG